MNNDMKERLEKFYRSDELKGYAVCVGSNCAKTVYFTSPLVWLATLSPLEFFFTVHNKYNLDELMLCTHKSVLEYAIIVQNVELVSYLVDRYPEFLVRINRDEWSNVLEYAVRAGSLELTDFFLSQNTSLLHFGRSSSWNHPFYRAVNDNKYAIVDFFLDTGLIAKLRHNPMGMTEDKKMQELLLSRGFLPSLEGSKKEGYSFLNKFSHIIKHASATKECHGNHTIPHNIFYIWITDQEHPVEPSSEIFSTINETISLLRNSTTYTDWQYSFVTNAPYTIKNTTDFFSEMDFNVVNINDLYPSFYTGGLVEYFVRTHHLGLAVDLAKYEVLNLLGGVYMDVNYSLKRSIDKDLCASGMVFNLFKYGGHDVSLPENSFIIAAPQHPIMQQSIRDIASICYGNDAARYKPYLNVSDSELTDYMYSRYVTNCISLFEPERDKIYIAHKDSNYTAPDDARLTCYEWQDFCPLIDEEGVIGEDGHAESWL